MRDSFRTQGVVIPGISPDSNQFMVRLLPFRLPQAIIINLLINGHSSHNAKTHQTYLFVSTSKCFRAVLCVLKSAVELSFMMLG